MPNYKTPLTTPDGKFGLKVRLPNYVYDALDTLAKQGVLGDTPEEVANHVLRQALFEKFSESTIAPIMDRARAARLKEVGEVVKEVVYPIPTTRPKIKRHSSTNKKTTQRRKRKSSRS